MVSKSVKGLLIFLAIIAICIIVYTRYFSGIFIEYDDGVYAYAIVTHNPVVFQTAFPGSMGFLAYGYPFFLAFGNSLYMPTFVGLSSILITVFLIFMIGRLLNSMIVSVFGSLFYAINPLVISYSTRLIPDTFTAMVLCLSILIMKIRNTVMSMELSPTNVAMYRLVAESKKEALAVGQEAASSRETRSGTQQGYGQIAYAYTPSSYSRKCR